MFSRHYIEDGKLIKEKSALSAVEKGEFTGAAATGVHIRSTDNDFNGIYVTGDSEYVINDPIIDFTGNGGDDFVGFGAAITASGNSRVTVNNAAITCRGAIRPAVVANRHGSVVVNDSDIVVFNGATPNVGREQKRVPWMLGISGNCRATNIVDHGKAVYNRCRIRSESWGALSTDDTKNVSLEVNECLVENTGTSGYGAYSIGNCTDIFSGAIINAKDYGIIIANGPAGAVLKNGAVINADRFGVMWHGNQGGVLSVTGGSAVNSGKTAFLIKGCGPVIQCADCVVTAKNSVILQLMDSDDPGSWDGRYDEPQGEDQPVAGRDLASVTAGKDPTATFTGMKLVGDFYNATTNLASSGGPGGPPDTDGLPGGPPPFGMMGGPLNLKLVFHGCDISGVISSSVAGHRVGQISEANNAELGEVTNTASPPVNNGVIVELEGGSRWTVAGTSFMTALTIDKTSKLLPLQGYELTMRVNGVISQPESKSYQGRIELSIKEI